VRARVRLRAFIAVTLTLTATTGAACNQASAIRQQAIADSDAVQFSSIDGVALSGRLFGPDGAKAGVVLAHMLPSDQRSWFGFADRLGAMGYRVLTFDFRGYCPGGEGGCSQGTKDVVDIWQDVAGAVGFLESMGIHRVGLIGASMGGTASLVVASQQGEAVQTVITLSAPASIEGLTAGPDVLQAIAGAKLFIAGNGDGTSGQDAQAFYDQSQPPKRVEILPTEDHGTGILEGSQSEIATNLITGFLAQHLPVR
jgi:dienelactone hydrolase